MSGKQNSVIGEGYYFYDHWAENWLTNIRWETWQTMPKSSFNCVNGLDAGRKLTCGSLNVFVGPGVGSAVTDESGLVIIALPNNRLLKCDLKAETAEFMDYSDDAAMVAPEFRVKLS